MSKSFSCEGGRDTYDIKKILIMDSCPISLAGTNRFLSQSCFNIGQHLSITTTTASDIPVMVERDKVNLVIMELNGQKESALDGLRAIGQLTTIYPPTPLVVCTTLSDPRLLGQLTALGVNGIYLKQDPLPALARCVRLALQGKTGYSPKAAQLIESNCPSVGVLTRREIEVLKRLFTGNSVTATAVLLRRDVRTISSHKRSAMGKLSFTSDSEFYNWGVGLHCDGLSYLRESLS